MHMAGKLSTMFPLMSPQTISNCWGMVLAVAGWSVDHSWTAHLPEVHWCHPMDRNKILISSTCPQGQFLLFCEWSTDGPKNPLMVHWQSSRTVKYVISSQITHCPWTVLASGERLYDGTHFLGCIRSSHIKMWSEPRLVIVASPNLAVPKVWSTHPPTGMMQL